MTYTLTHVFIELHVLAYELNLGVRVLDQPSKTLLDTLHLLRDGTEDTFLETIELVEASPSSDLTETNEDTSHGLEIKSLVATENQDETSKLHPKRLYRFSFA